MYPWKAWKLSGPSVSHSKAELHLFAYWNGPSRAFSGFWNFVFRKYSGICEKESWVMSKLYKNLESVV